jgi:hypothetical protein
MLEASSFPEAKRMAGLTAYLTASPGHSGQAGRRSENRHLPTAAKARLSVWSVFENSQPNFYKNSQPTSGFEPLTRCLQIRRQLNSGRNFGFPRIPRMSI